MGQPLLIRADADTRIGVGHFMRCLALAQAWLRQGAGVAILSNCQGDALPRRATSAGIKFVPLEKSHPHSSDIDMTLAQLKRLDNPWLVIDGYQFDPAYHQSIRTAGFRLLVIDDAAHLPYYHADVLLNQNSGAERLAYHCDPDTSLLLGSQYALLRPEFLPKRGWHKDIPRTASKVLITMGGSDPNNVTMKVIQALQQVDIPNLEATVVVGPANPNLETLHQAVQNSTHDLRLLTDVPDMAELMSWADVAVSAGGSTCWELAFMGLPSLLLVLSDNQEVVATGMSNGGAAQNLGDGHQISVADLKDALAKITRDGTLRQQMSLRGRVLVDGAGTERICEAMATHNPSKRVGV